MRVFAAPDTTDPRPGGFVSTIPGELLYRPFVCDTGHAGACGCERSLAGMTSQQGTTLAQVAEKDMTLDEYVDAHAGFLVDSWCWNRAEAEQEARTLAEVAAEYPAGALITVRVHEQSHVFDELEA